MQAEVISFRPGHELMTIIMAECNRLEINTTEWVLMKIHSALEEDNARAELKRVKSRALNIRMYLKHLHNPEKAKMLLDDLIDSI
jgi:hypothetical protein